MGHLRARPPQVIKTSRGSKRYREREREREFELGLKLMLNSLKTRLLVCYSHYGIKEVLIRFKPYVKLLKTCCCCWGKNQVWIGLKTYEKLSCSLFFWLVFCCSYYGIKKFKLGLNLMLSSLKTWPFSCWQMKTFSVGFKTHFKHPWNNAPGYQILLRDEGSLCWVWNLTLTLVT